MPKLQIIGCSSGMPEPDIATSSYLLKFKGKLYLLDCGEGTSSAMLRLKINYKRIEDIFISHSHSDHIIGIPIFIQMNHIAGRSTPLNIYLPPELIEPMRGLLYASYLFPETLSFEWRLFALKPNPIFRNEDITINIFPNRHLSVYNDFIKAGKLSNNMESYCFSISTAKTKMVYSGDLKDVADLDGILKGSNLLLTEGMHIDITQLLKSASEYGVRSVILTHLPSKLKSKHRLNKIKMAAKKFGLKEIYIAYEGAVYNY